MKSVSNWNAAVTWQGEISWKRAKTRKIVYREARRWERHSTFWSAFSFVILFGNIFIGARGHLFYVCLCMCWFHAFNFLPRLCTHTHTHKCSEMVLENISPIDTRLSAPYVDIYAVCAINAHRAQEKEKCSAEGKITSSILAESAFQLHIAIFLLMWLTTRSW